MGRIHGPKYSGFIPTRNRIHQVNFIVLLTVFVLPSAWVVEKGASGKDGALTLTKSRGAVTATAPELDLAAELGDERVVTAGLGIRTKEMSSFILRSYDAHTGDMITEDEFDLTVDEESEAAIDAGGGRVYAVGSGLNADGGLSLLVRAYDAGTGQLLWEDELNPAHGLEGRTTAYETTGRPVLASLVEGQSLWPTAQSLYLVQAAHTPTGKIFWQDEFLTSWRRDQDEGNRFSLSDPQVLALSFSIMVRTFDTATGDLLWRDEFNPSEIPTEPSEDEADFRESPPDHDVDYQRRLVRNLTPTTVRAAKETSL